MCGRYVLVQQVEVLESGASRVEGAVGLCTTGVNIGPGSAGARDHRCGPW